LQDPPVDLGREHATGRAQRNGATAKASFAEILRTNCSQPHGFERRQHALIEYGPGAYLLRDHPVWRASSNVQHEVDHPGAKARAIMVNLMGCAKGMGFLSVGVTGRTRAQKTA